MNTPVSMGYTKLLYPCFVAYKQNIPCNIGNIIAIRGEIKNDDLCPQSSGFPVISKRVGIVSGSFG